MTNNNDLLPLIQQAYDAFRVGDTVKASAFRAKLNICLKQRGQREGKEGWVVTLPLGNDIINSTGRTHPWLPNPTNDQHHLDLHRTRRQGLSRYRWHPH